MGRGAASPVRVGREGEMGRLMEALERARGGVPQALLVMVETGICKARLVEDFGGRSGVRIQLGLASTEVG